MTTQPQTTLALTNVLKLRELAEALDNSKRESRLTTFTGYAGVGKTTAAILVAQEYDMKYICLCDSWGKKQLAEQFANLVNCPIGKTYPETMANLRSHYNDTEAFFILDEFDFAVGKGIAEQIRELHDHCFGLKFILIGEEQMNINIVKKELKRFRDRIILDSIAEKVNLDDAKIFLQNLYGDELVFSDEFVEHLLKVSGGIFRLIHTNADIALNYSRINDLDKLEITHTADISFKGTLPKAVG